MMASTSGSSKKALEAAATAERPGSPKVGTIPRRDTSRSGRKADAGKETKAESPALTANPAIGVPAGAAEAQATAPINDGELVAKHASTDAPLEIPTDAAPSNAGGASASSAKADGRPSIPATPTVASSAGATITGAPIDKSPAPPLSNAALPVAATLGSQLTMETLNPLSQLPLPAHAPPADAVPDPHEVIESFTTECLKGTDFAKYAAATNSNVVTFTLATHHMCTSRVPKLKAEAAKIWALYGHKAFTAHKRRVDSGEAVQGTPVVLEDLADELAVTLVMFHTSWEQSWPWLLARAIFSMAKISSAPGPLDGLISEAMETIMTAPFAKSPSSRDTWAEQTQRGDDIHRYFITLTEAAKGIIAPFAAASLHAEAAADAVRAAGGKPLAVTGTVSAAARPLALAVATPTAAPAMTVAPAVVLATVGISPSLALSSPSLESTGRSNASVVDAPIPGRRDKAVDSESDSESDDDTVVRGMSAATSGASWADIVDAEATRSAAAAGGAGIDIAPSAMSFTHLKGIFTAADLPATAGEPMAQQFFGTSRERFAAKRPPQFVVRLKQALPHAGKSKHALIERANQAASIPSTDYYRALGVEEEAEVARGIIPTRIGIYTYMVSDMDQQRIPPNFGDRLPTSLRSQCFTAGAAAHGLTEEQATAMNTEMIFTATGLIALLPKIGAHWEAVLNLSDLNGPSPLAGKQLMLPRGSNKAPRDAAERIRGAMDTAWLRTMYVLSTIHESVFTDKGNTSMFIVHALIYYTSFLPPYVRDKVESLRKEGKVDFFTLHLLAAQFAVDADEATQAQWCPPDRDTDPGPCKHCGSGHTGECRADPEAVLRRYLHKSAKTGERDMPGQVAGVKRKFGWDKPGSKYGEAKPGAKYGGTKPGGKPDRDTGGREKPKGGGSKDRDGDRDGERGRDHDKKPKAGAGAANATVSQRVSYDGPGCFNCKAGSKHDLEKCKEMCRFGPKTTAGSGVKGCTYAKCPLSHPEPAKK